MKYEKINTLWKRDPDNKYVIMEGEYSMPEFENVKLWTPSEKVDGMNIRVIYTKDGVEFRGRTDKAMLPADLAFVLIEMFPVDKLAGVFDLEKADTAILYGEGYGAGIQKGGKYRDDVSFILFDVNIDGIWIKEDDVSNFAEALSIERVPYFEPLDTDGIVDMVQGRPQSLIGKPGTIMEGLVCRSEPLMLDRMGRRIIFKLKVEDYDKLEANKK